jgi:hypothetical protein
VSSLRWGNRLSNDVPEATKRAVRRFVLRTRDVTNVLRYGPRAPKYAELIWARPQDVRHALFGPTEFASCSGRVICIEERFRLTDLRSTPRIRSCYAHWMDGIPWESTPDHEVMLRAVRSGKDWAGCKTEDDIRARYRALDRLFEETKETMRLKTRRELDPKAYREEGGILICIGKMGDPLLYDGFHRFAVALVLDLPVVPAQLGFVDRSAVGSVERYRIPPTQKT